MVLKIATVFLVISNVFYIAYGQRDECLPFDTVRVDCYNPEEANRPSIRYCKKLMRKPTSAVGFGSLSFGQRPVETHNFENCTHIITSLIIGGEEAKAGEFPHMAALGWQSLDGVYTFHCGGSLISDQFVLTAAHCKYKSSQPNPIVRLGDIHLDSKSDGLNEINIGIQQFFAHENYNSKTKKYDIAVVKMVHKIPSGWKNIKPACLYPYHELKEPEAVATGFGRLGYSGDQSKVLKKVTLPIVRNRICGGHSIDITQMCAGGLFGHDTCEGDSGGPLQILNNDTCVYYIIGVTSYGGYCGSGEAAIYTRVNAHLDWIESKVWPN